MELEVRVYETRHASFHFRDCSVLEGESVKYCPTPNWLTLNVSNGHFTGSKSDRLCGHCRIRYSDAVRARQRLENV